MSPALRVSAQNAVEVPSDRIDPKQWAPALRKVYEVMRSGRWMTLAEIAFYSGYPEAFVSARIRQLNSEKGIPHQKRKAKDGKLYEYMPIFSSKNNLGQKPLPFDG